MSNDTATTITGLLKGIGVALATTHAAQDQLVYWTGLAIAVLMAIQGYLTNKPDIPPSS